MEPVSSNDTGPEKMKNNCRPQIVRHRRMINLIQEGARAGVYANAGTFMRALEISRATVMRDLDVLRDDEGAPIEYDASKKGYYLTDASWTLPPGASQPQGIRHNEWWTGGTVRLK